ncbi:hypothetical protein M885DRAFT_572106 [Pelagophyceae sp. CCMP2097]|nr:hypothetical protein M885DRAFT_572106 [Pelagophyceae sp. CCMP2097]
MRDHEFIEYWGTIGILNEEAFESIHAHQNNMLRRFACVRNRNHRDELMQRAFDVMQRTNAKTDVIVAERRPAISALGLAVHRLDLLVPTSPDGVAADSALGLDVLRLYLHVSTLPDGVCLDLIVPMLSDGVVADPALDVVVPRLDLPCCGTGMLLR